MVYTYLYMELSPEIENKKEIETISNVRIIGEPDKANIFVYSKFLLIKNKESGELTLLLGHAKYHKDIYTPDERHEIIGAGGAYYDDDGEENFDPLKVQIDTFRSTGFNITTPQDLQTTIRQKVVEIYQSLSR